MNGNECVKSEGEQMDQKIERKTHSLPSFSFHLQRKGGEKKMERERKRKNEKLKRFRERERERERMKS